MINKYIRYEDALFEHVKKVKKFNQLLIQQYGLRDIPYNLSGKAFPKIGKITDGSGKEISYRFHGRGATIFEENLEIFFNVDTSSKYQIILSIGGFHCFLEGYLEEYNEDFPLEKLMDDFEQRGIFIKRKASDLGTFHVNESWYEAKVNGTSFTGENRFDTDWL